MDNIIHSISDVITNSSTELFITPKPAAVKAIAELLTALGLNPEDFTVEVFETNDYVERLKKIVITRNSDNIKIPFSDLINKIFVAKELNV